jgi:hypothetical protein
MRGPVRHRLAEAADAAAESRDATARDLGRRVTLEPLSIVVATRSHLFADIATRSHLFADISCAELLCGTVTRSFIVDTTKGVRDHSRTHARLTPRSGSSDALYTGTAVCGVPSFSTARELPVSARRRVLPRSGTGA